MVGGGPAGTFFALAMLQKARLTGNAVEIVIFEKKKDLREGKFSESFCSREGCNYCAGGISPRLLDALQQLEVVIPDEIIHEEIKSLTIQGYWKNIVLSIPKDRRMYSVFRGSRPQALRETFANFDSFLSYNAGRAGARLLTAEVVDIFYDKNLKPALSYREHAQAEAEIMSCDLVVLAGGVNQMRSANLAQAPLVRAAQKMIPAYRPPKVRKTLIFELEVGEEFNNALEGELYFVEFGSKELKIDMASLIPKGKFITVVLIGPTIDRMKDADRLEIIKSYVQLPQIKRILPPGFKATPVCICSPNMTVSSARHPFGPGIALIGDMVVSRLYKDGIYSAYLTASGLADALIAAGSHSSGWQKYYRPVLKSLRRDNLFGRTVLLMNRIVFASPRLSRIFYQAVLSERRSHPRPDQRLSRILWDVASGDDSYRNSLLRMFGPRTLWLVFFGGFLITIRNYLTELVFGLRWHGFGRYPTGLHKEDFEEKTSELQKVAGTQFRKKHPEFESLYSIQIKAEREKTIEILGKFGDEDTPYFRPNLINVERITGSANEIGSIIRYKTPLSLYDFELELEAIENDTYFLYRVRKGFTRGGVLIFNIEGTAKRTHALYIYVGFDFYRGRGLGRKIWYWLLRVCFPGFVHDVLWNHSLCKLKSCVEESAADIQIG